MTGRPAPPHERTKRAHFFAFLAAIFLLSGVFLWMIGPYILSLFLGALLALMGQPLYERLRGRAVGPRTAAALTTILMLLLVLGPLAGFAYTAATQGVAVGRQLAELKEFSPASLTRALGHTRVARALGDPAEVNARIKEGLRSAGASLTAVVLAVARGLPQLLLELALALVAFYFFLIDGRAFVDFVLSRAAFERDVQDKIRLTFSDMARSTVLSSFAAAAAQAALIWIAFLALGVPGAFVAGAGTFFLAWMPLLGSVPAAAAGVAWLYVQDDMARMAVMIGFGVGAGLVDNLVRPLILKGRNDLHPLVGLVAIIAAMDMFGVLGIFVGPLLAAVMISMLEIWPEIAGRFGVEVRYSR